MLNEKFSRSEEAAIRRIIRKELDRSEKDIQQKMLKSKELDKTIETHSLLANRQCSSGP